jgi:hypothetical protein
MKFFSLEKIQPKFISMVFILKVIAGCALGLLYTYYYTDRTTADTFKFFDDGKILFGALFTNPKHFFEMLTGINGSSPELLPYYNRMNAWLNAEVVFNDSKTLVRLNAIFNLFSLGYYYVHVVFINFLSFVGLIGMFKVFQSFQKNKSKALFIATMLLPSVLFWGSGLLKDGLLLFALGMMLYSFNRIANNNSYRYLIVFVLSFFLLVITKIYVLAAFFPGLVAWYWSRNDSMKRIILKFATCYIVYFTLVFNVGLVSNKYDITDIIYYKQKNFYTLAENTNAKSLIHISQIAPSAWSILKHSPEAVLRVFVRPFITDSSSPLILVAAVENILILIMMLFCVLSFKRSEILRQPIFYFSILFVLVLFALIGLITPILGAMVRYKVPALPFLMFVFISMSNMDALRKKISGPVI